MRHRIHQRLERLEEGQARALELLQSRHGEQDDPIAKFESFLRLCGIEQGADESLAAATARALEITYDELWQQIASGIDPIHKFLTDQGVFEDIERRKAAGTWPGGGRVTC